jgi:SAM-dependent MidA family methyltransferase
MWILREIEARGGEVCFRDFMDLALYHPEQGYYTSDRVPWGRPGDYLTAPTASGWYGATVSQLVRDLVTRRGERLTLVDMAAGDGSFLASVITALGDRTHRVLDRVVGVELSQRRREQILRRLAGADVGVDVAATFVTGVGAAVVHISELYDALPIHRVEQTAEGLLEMTVRTGADGLEWGRRPARAELHAYLKKHGVELLAGQVAEVNLEAEAVHSRVLEGVEEALVLVLDYGYPAGQLYNPRGRNRGSLVTCRNHELGADPLDEPGGRDITAHVNFDDLRRSAERVGWRELGLMPMAEFLVRAGLGELLETMGFGINAELDVATVSARQEVKRLLDPEGMGSDLKMLVQGCGEVGEIAAELLRRAR